MPGARRNTNQIATLAKDQQHFRLDMEAEETSPFNKEAHFILSVGVLSQKLLPQRLTIGMLRRHPDRINRCITPITLQLGNLRAVGPQNAVLIGVSRKLTLRGPAFKADPTLEQLLSDPGRIRTNQIRGSSTLLISREDVWKDAEVTHRPIPGAKAADHF